jgi:hypothetical protein
MGKTFLLSFISFFVPLRFKRNAIHLSLEVASNGDWRIKRMRDFEAVRKSQKDCEDEEEGERATTEEDGIVLNRTLIVSNFIQISRISQNDFHLFSLDVFTFCFGSTRWQFNFSFCENESARGWHKQQKRQKSDSNCCKKTRKHTKRFEISPNKWLFWKIVINLISRRYQEHFYPGLLAWDDMELAEAAFKVSNSGGGGIDLDSSQNYEALVLDLRNLLTLQPFDIVRFFKASQLSLLSSTNTLSLWKLVTETEYNWQQCDNTEVENISHKHSSLRINLMEEKKFLHRA